MAIRLVTSTQDEFMDPTDMYMQIGEGEPPPGSYNPTMPAEPNDPPPPVPAQPSPSTSSGYVPMAGWEENKLNSPTADTEKYRFGRWLQDSQFYNGGSGAGSRGNMQAIVDAYNQQYGTNARAVGDDSIDFGNGWNAVDLINGDDDSWQWGAWNDPNSAPAASRRSSNTSASNQMGGLFSAISSAANRLQPSSSQNTATSPMPTMNQASSQSPLQLSRAVEAARMPYEIARKSQLNNARAALADRGLLGEPGQRSGAEATAINQIETNLAPAYTGALNDRLQQIDALGLANLEQNRLWNQFLASYGLDRDRVMYDMQQGNTDQYLQLLRLWLDAAQTSANGFI